MDSKVKAPESRVNGFAGRLDFIEGPSGRRRWPDDVKAWIVRESFEPGVTVSEVACRHRISPQHLTLWRRAVREGRLSVSVACDERVNCAPFVPLAIDVDRGGAGSVVNDCVVIEVDGVVLKLSAETTASRIAEVVSALEARR
jgi:transposase